MRVERITQSEGALFSSLNSKADEGSASFTVLLLEDDRFDRTNIMRQLQKTGLAISVQTASQLTEFKAALDQAIFDLILVDYRLPDGDGLAAQQLVQKNETNFAAPVVLMSNALETDVTVKAMRSGSFACVEKADLTSERLANLLMTSVKAFADASRMAFKEMLQEHREAIAKDVSMLMREELQLGALVDAIDHRIAEVLVSKGMSNTDNRDLGPVLGDQDKL